MKRFTPSMSAIACAMLLAAAPAFAQQGSGDAGSPPDSDAAQPPAASGSKLPGVVLERNVFVPVDAAGKPTSDQFIVVERRSLAKGDGESGASGDGAASSDVPTRFILVPQQSGDDSSDDDSSNDGSSGATQ